MNLLVLLREQARLIDRGVRIVALVAEPLAKDTGIENLVKASEGLAVVPFFLDPHLAGFARHEWAIDLLSWSATAPQLQRNRIFGLLLGYSGEAIKHFEDSCTTVKMEGGQENESI